MGVQFFGRETSWCFECTDSRCLDAALYVRDALRLAIPADRRIPPTLGATVPDRRSLLTPRALELAADAWTLWWDDLLVQSGYPRDPDAPPAFLDWEPSEASILRRPFVRLRSEAGQWIDASAADRPDMGIPWEVMARVAGEVAFDRGVPMSQVRGYAMVVSASGVWWCRTRPGVVVCSWDAAHDPQLASTIVRAAFDPEMAA